MKTFFISLIALFSLPTLVFADYYRSPSSDNSYYGGNAYRDGSTGKTLYTVPKGSWDYDSSWGGGQMRDRSGKVYNCRSNGYCTPR